MLTEEQVIEIYTKKIAMVVELSKIGPRTSLGDSVRGKSGPLSSIYGVSSRTIRDIWNRRTWRYATHHLWSDEELYLKSSANCEMNFQVHDFKLSHDAT